MLLRRSTILSAAIGAALTATVMVLIGLGLYAVAIRATRAAGPAVRQLADGLSREDSAAVDRDGYLLEPPRGWPLKQ